jgi:hypothetical protein
VESALAVKPDVCVVQRGGNDLVEGRYAIDVLADLDAIYRTLRRAGIQPVAATVLPHGDIPPDRFTGSPP